MDLPLLSMLLLLTLFSSQDGASVPPPQFTNPYERNTNKTLDQVIADSMGGVDIASNMILDDNGKILAELDMYLSQNQFLDMYEPPSAKDMYGMGLMSPPVGAVLDDAYFSKIEDKKSRPKRKAVRTTKWVLRWTDNVVPYTIVDTHFDTKEKYMIRRAMTEWERYTCVRFRPATTEDKNLIRLQGGGGCNSQLGMIGGTQDLNLEYPGCRFKGLYLHEIGHALGLVHEHQLPNRDDYIGIIYENVLPRMRMWFNKYTTKVVDQMNVPYEYSSVMHYGLTAFSVDGKKRTIGVVKREGEDEIGETHLKELAYTDVYIVNLMYNCSSHCPQPDKCGSEGHLDQNCECICKDGSSNCDKTKSKTDSSETIDQTHLFSVSVMGLIGVKDVLTTATCIYLSKCIKVAYILTTALCTYLSKCIKVANILTTALCTYLFKCIKVAYILTTALCTYLSKCIKVAYILTTSLCTYVSKCIKVAYILTTSLCTYVSKCIKVAYILTTALCTYLSKCIKVAYILTTALCTYLFKCIKVAYILTTALCTYLSKCIKVAYILTTALCTYLFKCIKLEVLHLGQPGECERNGAYMTRYCRKACGQCDTQSPNAKSTEVCKDQYSSSKCTVWKTRGDCLTNPAWMKRNCQSTCGLCGNSSARPEVNCANANQEGVKCEDWAKVGECTVNAKWMFNNCRKSCAMCLMKEEDLVGTDKGVEEEKILCLDKHKDCPLWASLGECKTNPRAMINDCRKSCQKCEDGTCKNLLDDNQCEAWAKDKECIYNFDGMGKHCAKSCGRGLCQGKSNQTLTTAPSVTERTSVRPKQVTTTKTTPVACKNLHKSDSECDNWAKHDQCNINPRWMNKNCYKSCSGCGGGGGVIIPETTTLFGSVKVTGAGVKCEDLNTDCATWAKYGSCDSNPSYSLKFCKKSCNNCNGCQDTEVLCSVWARDGHCQRNPNFMLRSCQKSCQACKLSDDVDQEGADNAASGFDANSMRTTDIYIWTLMSFSVLFIVF
ncbi:hypothetical protein Btru_030169 [Bulinus truncatus]|nr:hypothetical protein Btru_030169 [Bulinus truncatus]